MINKNLFLSPELLSRLKFSQSSEGAFFVQAMARHNPLSARPEEIIRQLFILSLIHHYHYPEPRIDLEFPIQMGRTKKRADIVVLGEHGNVEIVVEVKQTIDPESIEQLKSYLMATGADLGAVVSMHEFICFKRTTANRFAELSDLPICGGSTVLPSEHPAGGSGTAPLRALLQIDHFEKIDRAQVKLTVQGHTLVLPLVELVSFKKTQKRFLYNGIMVAAEIKQPVWFAFIRESLANTPDPPANTMPRETDAITCLQHILSHIIRISASDRSYDRTVDELIQIACGNSGLGHIQVGDAVPALMRIGIRVEGMKYIIANSHPAVAEILRKTPWGHSWGRVLRRLKGSESTKAAVRFFGVHSRGVILPIGEFEQKKSEHSPDMDVFFG